MSYIGEFISFLMFSIIFIENLEKTTVMGKKVLISEINSDVTETIFFPELHATEQMQTNTVLFLIMSPRQLIYVFQVFLAFLQEIDKNNSYFVPESDYLRKKLRIKQKGFSFLKIMWNGSYPEEKCFETQIELIEQFIAIVVFCNIFVGNYQKLPLLGKIWDLRNKLRFDGNNIFFLHQTCETGQILPKQFWPSKWPHSAYLSFLGVL